MRIGYRSNDDPEVAQILQDLYEQLVNAGLGVTQFGHAFTVRWYVESELVDASFSVTEITTVNEARGTGEVRDRYQQLFDKYPGLEEELYYAEQGEWPK